MLELGNYAREEHAAVGRAAAGTADELVLVGSEVRATAEAALKAGMKPHHVHLFAADLKDAVALSVARKEAAALVRESLRKGDVVIIKGSYGIGMDEVVKELQERRGGGGSDSQTDLSARA